VAKKGARDIHFITFRENDEKVSIIVSCNAEGKFSPSILTFSSVTENKEFGDGLHLGSKVYMSNKSLFVSSEMFCRRLIAFCPIKASAKHP
jgi:hypothetical protein